MVYTYMVDIRSFIQKLQITFDQKVKCLWMLNFYFAINVCALLNLIKSLTLT